MTNSDRVYLGLCERIQGQKLLPGDVLLEEQVAREYNVSRTPVREALRRLGQAGLVVRNGNRVVVRALSPAEVAEIYPIIQVLEGLAARLAARNVTPDVLSKLARLHKEMQEHAKREDDAAFISCNQRFHQLLVQTARNEHLAREIERFRTITSSFRRIQLRLPGRLQQSANEHQTLLDALRAGQPEDAERAMRRHVEMAERLLLRTLSAVESMRSFRRPVSRVEKAEAAVSSTGGEEASGGIR